MVSRHLAIIPDGNRRWADERQSSLREAYAIGFCNVVELALIAPAWGAGHLTFFGLSQDNRSKRAPAQVDAIFQQMTDSLSVASLLLRDNGIRIDFYGDLETLSTAHRTSLTQIAAVTAMLNTPAMHLNILVNYSIPWDLEHYASGIRTNAIPPCDLVFRSGRAKRISGFLPVQSSHAALVFSDLLWPDIDVRDLASVLDDALASPSTHGS